MNDQGTRPRPLAADEERLIVKACLLYYQYGYIQERVASRLGISRWKVGRLLQEGRRLGIVDIQVRHPDLRAHEMEHRLEADFEVDEVLVAPALTEDSEVMLDATARVAAKYLSDLRPTLIGVSWGRTLDAVAARIAKGWADGVHVVQINGAPSYPHGVSTGGAVTERLAMAGNGTATVLPVPAIVQQESTRIALEKDRGIAAILELADQVDVALFGLGEVGPNSVHVSSGYVSEEEIEALIAAGAVGDIVGRFIGADGLIVDQSYDRRTIGLTLEQLRAKKLRIAVAAGRDKRDVVLAALNSRLCNVLIIDEVLAQEVEAVRGHGTSWVPATGGLSPSAVPADGLS